MKIAILFVGSLWYTAWVDAGQPNLNALQKMKELNLNGKPNKSHDDCLH
jgi:hypothetical protein